MFMQPSDKPVRNPEEVAGRGPGAGLGSGAHTFARAATTAKNTVSVNVRQESAHSALGEGKLGPFSAVTTHFNMPFPNLSPTSSTARKHKLTLSVRCFVLVFL